MFTKIGIDLFHNVNTGIDKSTKKMGLKASNDKVFEIRVLVLGADEVCSAATKESVKHDTQGLHADGIAEDNIVDK